MQTICNLSTLPSSSNAAVFSTIWTMVKQLLLSWPQQDLFPVLDALRFAVAHVPPSETLSNDILDAVLPLLQSNSSATVLQLVLKIVCNMFAHQTSRKEVVKRREQLVAKCNSVVESLPQERPVILEVGLASVPLNFTVMWVLEGGDDDENEAKIQILSSLVSSFLSGGALEAAEAAYRAMVALGTLLNDEKTSSEVKDLAKALDTAATVDVAVKSVKPSAPDKVKQVAEEIKRVLA